MRWVRTLLRVLVGTAVFVAVVAVVGQFFLTSSPGRSLVLEGVLPVLSRMLGHTLHVERTSGFWPREIDLAGVTLSDRDGTWLEIDKFHITWDPTALLHGDIAIDTLDIHNAHLLRLPAGKSSGNTMTLPDFMAWGRTLDGIQADSALIELLRIEPEVFGQPLAVRIKGSLKPEEEANSLDLTVERKDAPGLATLALRVGDTTLSLDAQADLAGVGLTAVVTATGPAQTLSGSVGVSCDGAACPAWTDGGIASARVEAVFSGTRKAPAADLTFNIGNIKNGARTLDSFEGAVAVKPSTDAQALRMDGHGTLKGLAHLVPDIAAVIAADGAWTFAGDVSESKVDVESFAVKSGDTAATVTGTLAGTEISGGALDLEVRGLGRLAGLDDAASRTHTVVKLATASTAPTFTADGTISVDIADPPPAITTAPAFTAPIKIVSALSLTPDRLRLADVTALWGPATLKGDSVLARTAEGLDHQTSTANLAIKPDTYARQTVPLDADIALTGGFSALAANITATLAEYRQGAGRFNAIKVAFQGKHAGRGWQGPLQAHALLNDAPVTFTATLHDAPDAVALRGITLDGAGLALRGNLRFPAGKAAADGTLEGTVEDLEPWMALADVPATGRGDIRLTLSGTTHTQAALLLNAHKFASMGIMAESLRLSAELDDPFSGAALNAHISALDGNILSRRFDTLKIGVDGTLRQMTVTAQARGQGLRRFALDLKGLVNVNGKTEIAVSQFALKDGAVEAHLPAPAHLTFTDDAMTLAPMRLAVGAGAVEANLDVMRKTGQVKGRLALTALTFDDPKDPLSLGQTFLDGAIDISGPATQADLDAAITARFKPRDGGVPVVGNLNTTVKQGRAQMTGVVNGLSAEDARLTANIPAKVDFNAFRLDIDMQAAASARLTWHGDIKPLWLMLGNEQHSLAGQTDVDVQLAGSLGEPAVTGGIQFSNGFYENLSSGTALHNIELNIATQSPTFVNLKLAATDTGAGRLTAQGTARSDGVDSGWFVDAAGDLKQFHILRRDDITAAATGHVTYKGPLLAGTLGGNLQIVRSEYRLGESYEPEIPLLRGFAGRAMSNDRASKVRLDIALTIPDVLRIDGQGLEAFWRGDIKATGDINHPDLVGKLTLARGTFSFVGKTFDLDSGTVTFTGGGKIDPDLNIVAVREAEDITATLTITGRASKPQIALSSRPALPQDEVLARLLFRKGATQLGPFETLQLANAAADLSGLSRGGISGLLRRASGLDIVGFGGASGSAIVLGRQISSALYVGIEQNVNDSSRRIVVEWRLTPQFSLQSTTTDDKGADLGVVWRKNY